ncbi:MAG TPA: hypothetical protein VGA37_12085, partial [Gemmatimonadales bacterium]
MTQYLAHRLCASDSGVVPILIDSKQWTEIPSEHLQSLAKTIVHSFRHYDAPIAWIEGHEDDFLRVMLKAELFAIIFDGFDEYVLRNRHRVTADETLATLAELASVAGSRIVITSRTSFWDTSVSEDGIAGVEEHVPLFKYKILPFDRSLPTRVRHLRFEFTEPSPTPSPPRWPVRTSLIWGEGYPAASRDRRS